MNLHEFAKLKTGDTVKNVFTHSQGIVTDVVDQGVKVRWGPLESAMSFTYTVQSTSWMHWSLPDETKPRTPAQGGPSVA